MEMLTPQRIRAIRLALKLTADRFAKKMQVSIDCVFKWESGVRHPTYAKMIELNKLAEEAGIDINPVTTSFRDKEEAANQPAMMKKKPHRRTRRHALTTS